MKDTEKEIGLLEKMKQTSQWFREFCSWSGISQYRISDNKISKAFWMILYGLGVCFTLVLVNSSINRFFSYPFITKVGRESNFTAEFPSVTICNPNRIHCKHLLDLIQTCSKVRKYHYIIMFVTKIIRIYSISYLTFCLIYNFM